ncbi:MAG: N-acetylmuramoyl-L-alanine amidase [Candidatus Sumerlaeia bacterium]|nr:N-acetylmuramoyl-L-alanine amidase [Candidatus Sumerlaeia bacterium]
MRPRALDRRIGRLSAAWTVVLLFLPCAAAVSAVSLRDIRTEILERYGVTRCVVELSGETPFFERNYLESKKYFLVDIYHISPPAAERFITPASGPVRQVLVLNRKDPETQVLTLVFYLTDTRLYRVFSVQNPFRIVIDVYHATEGLTPTAPKPQTVSALTGAISGTVPRTQVSPAVTPAVAPGLAGFSGDRYRKPGKKIIILDPGHGGSDPGAESYVKINGTRLQEKDLNLAIAKEIKRLIDASPNMEAFMTRETDKYMSLADRQNFCDRHKPPICGDLFLSIHCNASDSYRTRGARGIEFYYLNPTGTAKGSLRYLEELENRNGGSGSDSTSPKDHPIFFTLARESLLKWLTEGRIVCEHLKASCLQVPYYRAYNNRELMVQQAFFRVLFQADMPAVLVEVGFLTNAEECQKLANPAFQKQAATAIYNGIASYFKARDERFEPKLLALPVSP